MSPKKQAKATLLFRCVANIELGLMAKGLLQQIADQHFTVEAAGNFPTNEDVISSAAIDAMAALNIDISSYPLNDHICKGCDFTPIRTFDYAISFSDKDFTDCVHLNDDTVTAIWKLPEADAPESAHPNEAYVRARKRILDLLTGFISLHSQPDWADMSKARKELALNELYERLVGEEYQIQPVEAVTKPSGVPAEAFWHPKFFKDLSAEQGVYPVEDWEKLSSGWPEDADFDEFLEAVRSARQE